MKARDSFKSRWGFILACIGSAVGMGNIWMFPTRVSLYGGGSFIIPYFIFVILIGSTGIIGEMSFGRATRFGPVGAFGAACETKGRRKVGEAIGLIPVLGSLAMAIGYTVVLGWIWRRFWQNGICIWKQRMAAGSTGYCNDYSDVRYRTGN